jgi:N-acetylglucosaminyldiphosphoundecaprenol N-acetyl-beta-D-mannosaminyltransferase
MLLQSQRLNHQVQPGVTRVRASHHVLGVDFDLITYEDVLKAIRNWRATSQRHYVTLTPPYSVVMCRRDNELKDATRSAMLTLPDGVGIIWAATLLGYPHHGRVSGPTLMLKLCDWGRTEGLRHFLYGGAPGVADALVSRLSARFPGLAIAGTYCPPFRQLAPEEDREVVRKINETKPDVVWVGLGSPKQEKWMASHVGRIEAAVLIGIGAAFDFHAGRVKWAPAWMRRMGIEWAYRLAREPKRMWRRNVNSVVFLARVLHQRVINVNGSGTSRVHHESV